MNVLVCVSSKSPNPLLYDCISSLYTNQINNQLNNNQFNYKICVLDSDSNDFSFYDKIKSDFPEVELLFIKNINYEYGAWKYASNKYPNYDIYFCIQDSIKINEYINLNLINDNTAFTHYNTSGYNAHQEVKRLGIEYLKDSGLDYNRVIDTDFNLAQHNIFIISNKVINDLFNILKHPPVSKEGSCTYERLFGIYFILMNINTINFEHSIIKKHGSRI